MHPRKKVTIEFLFLFIAGFLYLFLTNKTPYEKTVSLEENFKKEINDMEHEGVLWIKLDSISTEKIEKGDHLYIEESFARVDSVNVDSVGIYSPKGFFDISKRDIFHAKSFIFKRGTFGYEYARRCIWLEEVQNLKKKLENNK
jgi:hypothetical protein